MENHVKSEEIQDNVFEGGGSSATLETPIEIEVLDYVHTEEWKKQKKHIFILSEAGKPIYSR